VSNIQFTTRFGANFKAKKPTQPHIHGTHPSKLQPAEYQPARQQATVRFQGQSPPKTPYSLKHLLKTLIMMGLLGSGIQQAQGMQWFSGGNKTRELVDPSQTAPSANKKLLTDLPPVTGSSYTSPSEATQPVPVTEKPNPPLTGQADTYTTGDMLAHPSIALQLAEAGQIAESPDALKLITGPGNEKILYEIRLKSGATVGLSVPQNELEHQEFLNALKGEFNMKPKTATVQESKVASLLVSTVEQVVPLVIMVGIIHLLRKKLEGGSGGPNAANRFSQAKPAANSKKNQPEKPVRFKDVRGYPEVIRELQRIKERYVQGNLKKGHTGIKLKPIKGLLLEGPPGTGKSMMAKALATESNVPFHYVSGSEFVEMFVGVGAARVRSLFAEAKKNADKYGGAIIFIDELDSIGGKRNMHSYSGGNEERTNTLNELLQQMSGFNDDPRIMILAATNRADYLDDALKRSGRFDKIVKVDLPHDKEQRRDILDKYLSEHATAQNLDRDTMAEFTQGKSGADLANLVNQMAEAAVDRITEAQHHSTNAAQLKNPEFHKLNTIDFLNAWRNMEMGIPREAQGTEDERKTVAVHEVVGHGLVARAAKTALQMVSMQPRGEALGHVITDPRASSSKLPTLESMLKDIVISMGGRASEREMLGAEYITPGASGDIAQSKAKIRQMLATRMLPEGSGADYHEPHGPLNDQDCKLADMLLKQAEQTAADVIRTVPREQLWQLVNKALNLNEELVGDEANAFYQDILNTIGEDTLYRPIEQFVQQIAKPKETRSALRNKAKRRIN